MIDLDRLLAQQAITRVQLIKMDIQGAEGLALRGMTATLANNPALVIFAEFWPWGLAQTGVTPADFLRELLRAGFRFQAIDEDKRRLIDVTDVDEFLSRHANLEYTGTDMRRSHANLICIKNG
jgi:hypothetical protein